MIRNKPEVILDKRYNIKEFRFLLCISRGTISKYTKLGIINPIRISSREVYYPGSEILKLWEVLTNKSEYL